MKKSAIDPWSEYGENQAVIANKNALIQNYKKLLFLPSFLKIFKRKKSKFVVIGLSLFNQLSKCQRDDSHIIFKPRDLIKEPIRVIKNFRNFTLNLGIYRKIYNALKKSIDINHNFEKESLLRISPKILIVGSTMDPMQRLWLMAAKDLGIATVCIQHGIMSSLSPPEIKERNIVDFYIAYNRKQSNIIQSMIPISKHRWLFDTENFFHLPIHKDKITICLIGSDYERYGEIGVKNKRALVDIYRKLVNAIKNIHGSTYADILYKQHPSESQYFLIDEDVKVVKNINEDQIDLFFGVTSTYLMNLASINKCAIQVCAQNILSVDRYEDYGFCKSIDLSLIEAAGLNFILDDGVVIPKLVKKNFPVLIESLITNS